MSTKLMPFNSFLSYSYSSSFCSLLTICNYEIRACTNTYICIYVANLSVGSMNLPCKCHYMYVYFKYVYIYSTWTMTTMIRIAV